MSQKVITSDIYEAGYYLTLGAVVEKAELIEENKKALLSNDWASAENKA